MSIASKWDEKLREMAEKRAPGEPLEFRMVAGPFGDLRALVDDALELERLRIPELIEKTRAEERDACARIVEETPFAEGTHTGTRQLDVKRRAAAAIRARK